MIASLCKNLRTGEKLGPVGSECREAGKTIDSAAGQNQAQCALMLVGVGGLESFFGFGADDDGGEVSTPLVEVGLIALVEGMISSVL